MGSDDDTINDVQQAFRELEKNLDVTGSKDVLEMAEVILDYYSEKSAEKISRDESVLLWVNTVLLEREIILADWKERYRRLEERGRRSVSCDPSNYDYRRWLP